MIELTLGKVSLSEAYRELKAAQRDGDDMNDEVREKTLEKAKKQRLHLQSEVDEGIIIKRN